MAGLFKQIGRARRIPEKLAQYDDEYLLYCVEKDNKGGEFRKWYGNNDCIVNWQNEGDEIFNHAKADKRNVQDYPLELKFKPSASWSLVTSGQPAFRYKENNLSDIAGMSFFTEKQELLILLGFCNSKIAL